VTRALATRGDSLAARAALTAAALDAAASLEDRMLGELGAGAPLTGFAHRRHWRRLDARSRIDGA